MSKRTSGDSKGFVVAVLFACWLTFTVGAFGSSTEEFREIAAWGLLPIAVLTFFLLPSEFKRPLLPWWFLGALAFLLFWGGFMTWNAHADHSRDTWSFTFYEDRPLSELPGSVVSSASWLFFLELSAIAIGLLAISRATQSKAWIRLLQILATSGFVVTLIALLHKALKLEAVWGIATRHPETYFAPFVYNANAAAFLNLVLPISLALTLRAWRLSHGKSVVLGWLAVSIITFCGVITAASKGGFLICLGVLFLFVVVEKSALKSAFRAFRKSPKSIETKLGSAVLAAVLAAFLVTGTTQLIKRWETLANTLAASEQSGTVHSRLEMMKLLSKMASPEEGGWHGFGAGSFPHVFPWYNQANPEALKGGWHRGHCDPLQTLVEWGWIGFAGWMVLGIGSVICGISLLRRKPMSQANTHLVTGMTIGLVGVGFHSCFDFPLSIFSIHFTALLFCTLLCSLYTQARIRS